MKKFKDYISEGNVISDEDKKVSQDFFDSLEKMFRKEFPKGFFRARVDNRFGSASMAIRFGLGHFPNNIEENDPILHRIMIHLNTSENFKEADNIEFNPSGVIYVNPDEGSYLAMQSVKTKLTAIKKKGTLDKIEKKMKSWFPRLRKIFDENKENLYGVDKIPNELLK